MFNNVEIEEREGKEFAQEINAVFQETSASNNIGIEDLFEKLARQYFINTLKGKNTKEKEDKKNVSLNQANSSKKKKCCV